MGTNEKVKKPIYKRFWFWFVGIVALIVIAASLGSGDSALPEAETATPASSDENNTNEDSPENNDASTDDNSDADNSGDEEPDVQVLAIGDSVTVGDWEVSILSVSGRTASVGNEFLSTEAQGDFLPVELSLTNNGSSASTFFASDFVVVDTQDREFKYSTDAVIYSEGEGLSILDDVNPGNTLTGFLYFDVPADADIDRVFIDDGWFSDPVVVQL